MSSTAATVKPLECMEVWGGNGSTARRLIRPGLDIWLWSRGPFHSALGGGDLHLLSSCASGRITRMLLADVCGGETSFHETARELCGLMKRNANLIQHARAVDELSCQLDLAAQRGAFVSTLLSTYFAPTRSFSLCNAGHPPPLVFRAAGREWSFLKQPPADRAGLAASPAVVSDHEYQRVATRLNVGDMVLSYSTAWTECRAASGRTLGMHGWLERVRNLDAQRPDELTDRLAEQVAGEHRENLDAADATLLLCRATKTRVGWRNHLLAPLRLLRRVADRTRIR